MATTITTGGVYKAQATDLNIYVKTGAPVAIMAPISPALDQSFRVFSVVPNASIMMLFAPNRLNNYGQTYTFGQGLASIAFRWDGTLWNAF